MLFVISAPSGAGKTTIIRELFRRVPDITFSVSATTRTKRKDEKDGIDYYFMPRDEFEKKAADNEFAEWENVHGNYYGTLKTELKKGIAGKVDMVFDVDVKGALSIKKLIPEAVTIFIDAPKSDLIERLRSRNTDTQEQIDKRIERMEMELNLKKEFDHVVVNETNHSGVDKAVSRIIEIIKQNKNKSNGN